MLVEYVQPVPSVQLDALPVKVPLVSFSAPREPTFQMFVVADERVIVVQATGTDDCVSEL